MISSIQEPNELRKRLQGFYRTDEKSYIRYLVEKAELSADSKSRIYNIAKQVIEKIKHNKLSIVDSFMQQYSLSNDEGIALMCLAESLLRIPDDYTIDEIIKDKIANQEWNKYLGHSSSVFVNASTWSLMIGSSILRDNEGDSKFYYAISKLLKNLGEPIIRKAVKQAMSMFGNHFVVGETIEEALRYAKLDDNSKFLYSFDMLGEAAHTAEDAEEYFNSYMHSIKAIGESTEINDCFKSHGISIKLSALHPRYEFGQFDNIAEELRAKLLELCREAKKYNISLCIDAEEIERLEMSLILFEQLRLDESLSEWEGLGLAVQAYQKRALSVLDFVEDVAIRSNHKIMVRLVKGAYWDSEIKRTQELGLNDYSVFTRKSYTDVSYLVCAQKLLSKPNSFYPCFGTHNVYTFASIMELADKNHPGFEFQRLHGMAKDLYDYAMSELATNVSCRVYAPVGKRSDLLPYLVRRLLENGANSSFVNQINDPNVKIDELISDPLEKAISFNYESHPGIPLPQDILGPERKNSLGMDISDSVIVSQFADDIKEFGEKKWQVGPIIDGQSLFDDAKFTEVVNPAHLENVIGEVSSTTSDQALNALEIAHNAFTEWQNVSAEKRAKCLEKAADLLEERMKELIYILIVEAGKILSDAIAEIREAVDFLRYYATIAKNELSDWKKLPGPTGEDNFIFFEGRGVFLCISPWNFPLAIFLGQVSAALAAGNTVLAKPAEQTPIIAYEAVKILHEAGIPKNVLHLIPGNGGYLGKILVPDNRITGVAFTGSTQTAQIINKMLADRDGPIVPLIAETGGLNAMIVDSSALLEQVTMDALLSAFRSSGQRCSALRVLFIQEDIAEKQIKMICGAVQELKIGDPMHLSTDIGPIIDKTSLDVLIQHTQKMSEDKDSNLLFKVPMDTNSHNGYFFPPYIYEIQKISQLKQEVFGPILHIIRFNKSQLNEVISDINNTGYGLTFSLQSRIQSQIDTISKKISVGNVYINRNQIGAAVGIQPFGGRGLSGTGPTVSDRIAQEVVRSVLEPELEKVFDEDSYGYRPNKSALDAIGQTRKRCFDQNWLIEFDIKGMYDNIDHNLLMKAVRKHTTNKWVLLYIQRWLSADMQLEDGTKIKRLIGVPQGGVVSPILSNLFMHYSFDAWMRREYPSVKWARYADDGVIHCVSKNQAQLILTQLEQRLKICKLEVKHTKTKIIYCQDGKRRDNHENVSFTFLGYEFRKRLVRNRKDSSLFVSFTPTVSKESLNKMKKEIRSWKFARRTNLEIEDIS